jgi:hypothetical protein
MPNPGFNPKSLRRKENKKWPQMTKISTDLIHGKVSVCIEGRKTLRLCGLATLR